MLKPWTDDRLAANGLPVMDNFQKWFNSSKVTTDQHEPLVVYHATSADFTAFNTRGRDLGSHFGTKNHVNSFADVTQVIPVYLSIKNPLWLEDRGGFELTRVIDQLIDAQVLSDAQADILSDQGAGGVLTESQLSNHLQCIIEQAGYDGIFYINRREGAHDPFGADGHDGEDLDEMTDEEFRAEFPAAEVSYIVFNPSQVKSALSNAGLYLKSNPFLTDEDASLALLSAHRAKLVVAQMTEMSSLVALPC